MNSIYCNTIQGERTPLDIMCIKNEKMNSIHYGLTAVSFGVLADVLAASVSRRWMGPHRYTYSSVQKWLTLCHYKVKIRYLPATKFLPGQSIPSY